MPSGDEPGVVGFDPHAVGPGERDAKWIGDLGGDFALRLPDRDAGIVGVPLRPAVGAAHGLEKLVWILAASGQDE